MRFPPVFAGILRERLLCWSLLGAGALLVISNQLGFGLWRCAFRATTGVPCPGCGMTRSMGALARGRWHDAMHLHPFAPVFGFAMLVMIGVTVLPEERRLRILDAIWRVERRTGFSLFVLVALMIWGLWRMWHGPWV